MAKRKRLTPANPMFFEGDTGETVPVSAPIAGVVADASATAALAEMSDTLIRARTEGRMVISVPLDRIDLGYLMRDRLPVYDADMDAWWKVCAPGGNRCRSNWPPRTAKAAMV